MKSVASAPGKIILFGEHFVVYGIRAILGSIDKRITATSQFLDEKAVRIRSSLGEFEMSVDSLQAPENIQQKFMKPFFHIAQKAIAENHASSGIEIAIESQIPAGVGLGSSSAACVAVAASVNGLFGRLTRAEVSKIALDAERTIFPQNSGADSSVSTFGGLATYDLKNGFQEISSKSELSFIISDSGQVHDTHNVVAQVRNFKERNEDLFMDLCRQETNIVDEAVTYIRENSMTRLGLLMQKNHDLLKKIGVSTDKIDTIVAKSQETSYGAKITGAGGGGCAISLVDTSNSKTTLDNLKNMSNCFVAKIDYSGLKYE